MDYHDRYEFEIFDPVGRRVHRSKGTFSKTDHGTVQWNGRDDRGQRVDPGVYLYRFKTSGRIVSGKLIAR